MLYIYLPVLYYQGNLYVTEGAYPGGRGFPLSQRSFLCCFLGGYERRERHTPPLGEGQGGVGVGVG